MNRILIVGSWLLLSASLLLTACTPQAAVQTVEVTRIAPATVEVTRLVEVTRIVEITSTPVPATATPAVTATPVFQRWTSNQVLEAFRAAGLEVGDTWAMTDDEYGLSPARAPDATRFLIPSMCADCGGRIFAFDDPAQLKAGEMYFVKLGENNRLYFSWTFVRDNILVQIGGDLPEARAQEYEKALRKME